MASVDEREVDDGVFEDVGPRCVALVPTTQELHWSSKLPLPRPDSSFVTQLIATAEQAPQTRSLRRATSADALAAYSTPQRKVGPAGLSTRQVI